MKSTLGALAACLAFAAPALPGDALATPPELFLHYDLLAAADELGGQADAWRRWADDFSREMRESMVTMYGPRVGPQKVVKNAPYSAQVVTETIQTLADGNTITRRKTGAVYRDAEGRTRQETAGDGRQATVYIIDPVESKHIVLLPGAKRAIVTPRVVRAKVEVKAGGKEVRVDDGRITIDGREIGPFDAKVRVKTIEKDGEHERIHVEVVRVGDAKVPGVVPPLPPLPPRPPLPPGAVDVPIPPLPPMPGVHTLRFESTARLGKGVTTSLGTKDIEGVRAEGKSTAWTIPAGEIGNRDPIRIVSETWHSPELQVTVLSRYSDPRTGESIYRLASVKRAEPAADLFKVPEDYETRARGAKRAK